MIFTKSKNFKQEYCCTIIKVNSIEPIENSDFLGIVNVNGFPIVVRKDQINVGDIVFYAANETQLAQCFLFSNNLFENSSLNKDTTKKSYFNKAGRVRTIKLRGIQSFGFIFTYKELQTAYNLPDIDLTQLVGTDFDLINDKLFIKAYVPDIIENSSNSSNSKTLSKVSHKHEVDKLIPGEFHFHYDTNPLGKNLDRFKLNDVITVSTKLHGTSAIFACIKSNIPNKLSQYKRFINKFINVFPKSHVGYSTIYSSRTVIKNRWTDQFGSDIWGEYAKLLNGKIPFGITIYGEIIGYLTGKSTYIQKGYDYGCKPGTNKLMIYRITQEDTDGHIKEFNVDEVYAWTLSFMGLHPELKERIQPIDILYHGTVADFTELTPSHHWKENFYKALSTDGGFYMEQNEPLCNNKVPREGIVIRIDNDPINEAFKLKCVKFLTRESKEIDKGNIDAEMQNTNY